MHKIKEQLYQQIKDIKTKDEFEKEIKQLQKEYDELFYLLKWHRIFPWLSLQAHLLLSLTSQPIEVPL